MNNPNYIPPNTDRLYPNYLHQADYMPECICDEYKNECLLHAEWCDGCNRLASYCGCP